MSTVPREQSSITVPGGGAPASLWRRVITPTGAPPAWGLVRYLLGGIVAGVVLSAALPHFRATLVSELTGGGRADGSDRHLVDA